MSRERIWRPNPALRRAITTGCRHWPADLVGRKVDLIMANSPPSALAAKNATSTIPIVFRGGSDPVGDGLVASLARPGGNLTGVSLLIDELTAVRLGLLSELVPRAGVIALLMNPNNPNNAPE